MSTRVPAAPVVLLVTLALGSACAHRRPTAAPAVAESTVSGIYRAGFEASLFAACEPPGGAGDGPWWVVLGARALVERDSLAAALPAGTPARYLAVVRGRLGRPEPAGHLGQSRRYLVVTHILALRPAGAAADPCAASP